jgi:hypothetical protein
MKKQKPMESPMKSPEHSNWWILHMLTTISAALVAALLKFRRNSLTALALALASTFALMPLPKWGRFNSSPSKNLAPARFA